MNEWMVFMNRKSLPSFTTQNVKVRESNQNQVKLCFRMFLVKIKDQRICFQGFQQNLSDAQTPHWKCANNLDECFINFEWRIRNDKKYSASFLPNSGRIYPTSSLHIHLEVSKTSQTLCVLNWIPNLYPLNQFHSLFFDLNWWQFHYSSFSGTNLGVIFKCTFYLTRTPISAPPCYHPPQVIIYLTWIMALTSNGSFYLFPLVPNSLLSLLQTIWSFKNVYHIRDFPSGPVAKTLSPHSRGPRFDPWSGI